MKKITSLIPILTLMLIVLVGFTASCDKRNPPPIIPAVAAPAPLSELRTITRIWAEPEFIYQDNNITSSTIGVEVKDGENFGVFNQIVQFKTDKGRVLTSVATDSTGVARTTFWDDGDVGMAKIFAVVRKYSATAPDSVVASSTDSIMVEIKPIPAIASIQLNLPKEEQYDPLKMIVMQTINVTAKPINTVGENVPNNTLVVFTCEKGRFVDAAGVEIGKSTLALTLNGTAAVKYSSWTTATTGPGSTNETITAAIGGVSKTRQIVISPGRPANMGLTAWVQTGSTEIESYSSDVGSSAHINMHAHLTDVFNNDCPQQSVKFTTDLGSFLNTTQLVRINTETNGIAKVRFTPGLSAGAAQIQATANGDTLIANTIFNVTSDEIHSISFTQTDQINLNVANTGGLQSAILRVKLRDINGNLINSADSVYFKIVNTNAPAGANLNNQGQMDSVLVISNGGEAQISVNSGTASGMLKIRASVSKGNSYIYSLKTNIVIHAGPPAPFPNGIIPFIGEFNTGTNMGGGLWRVIAGASVKDIHNNPVDKGTAVWFELLGAPDCQIGAEAYVGNVSVNGDSIIGTAFTILTYTGSLTNQSITIRANCGDDQFGNDNYGLTTVFLPLNDPRFEMQAQPIALYFDENPPTPPYSPSNPEYKTSDIHCFLTDGQGIPIKDSIIMLTNTRGMIIEIQGIEGIGLYADNPPLPWRIITNSEGRAKGRLALKTAEIPPPDPQAGTPGTETALVTGRILGAGTESNTSITGFRYLGTSPW
ncbi:MAG: hypothetical protein PHY48_03135 [Candidatus Cloacimonetes bacterium]|nr:hypothetical protein [Candidatus Cloacimonadota bacterium]